MTRSSEPTDGWRRWQEQTERMNAQFADALAENVEAQAAFTDAWLDALDSALSDEALDGGLEGSMRAYETWMNAARDSLDALTDAFEGEDVPPETFRDTWLNAANQAWKEIMGTAAFAAATGEAVETGLDLRRQAKEASEATLRDMGLPTESDIREVGDRLVELERRQHAVEQQLDRILDALEGA